MGLLANLRFGVQRVRNRGKRPCGHLDQIHDVTPTSTGCQPCLDLGDTWVHLRMCMTDGQVLCCDSSKNKHASRHALQLAPPTRSSAPWSRVRTGCGAIPTRPWSRRQRGARPDSRAVSTREVTMARPALVVVYDNQQRLAALDQALQRRFGADYQILAAAAPAAALDTLRRLRLGGKQVALVLADQWLAGMTGVEFLCHAHELHPTAKRVLFITYGDAVGGTAVAVQRTSAHTVLRACLLPAARGPT